MRNHRLRKSSALGLALACGLFVFQTQAHGPFDNSIRVILREESLEVMVTMGNGAATAFMKDSSPEALRPHAVGGGYPLPKEMAARLCEVTAAGVSLPAKSVEVRSDGLEVAFTAVYPPPSAGPLGLRARFFEGIPELRQGSVALTDENGNQFSTTLLSRETASVELPLPPHAPAPVAGLNPASSNVVVPATVASPSPGVMATQPLAREARGRSGWFALISLGALIIVGVWFWFRASWVSSDRK